MVIQWEMAQLKGYVENNDIKKGSMYIDHGVRLFRVKTGVVGDKNQERLSHSLVT